MHDFGARATTAPEQAAIGGAAHLSNFMGTDTVVALRFLKQFYKAKSAPGFSVNATEHSIMTAKGRSGEEEVFLNLLQKYPTGLLSMVIDSYDYRNFVKMAGKHRDKILARDGKLVFRPDSGEPVYTSLDTFLMIEEEFGMTENQKGYRVLNPKVGMLWGDGIDLDGIDAILQSFKRNYISSSNIVFGMGGGLLQKLNRDTMRCAFKCSAQVQNGQWVDIQKNPVDASKASKKGRLGVMADTDNKLITINKNDMRYIPQYDLLQRVFFNGSICQEYDLADIRRTW